MSRMTAALATAALIIGVCVSLSVSAWLASLFTMISISSRGRRSWAGLVYVVTVAATIVGYFIQDSAEGWFEGLLVCGVSAVMLLVPVLIGMYRWSRRRRIRALQAEALGLRGPLEVVHRRLSYGPSMQPERSLPRQGLT